jgi:hypothetical protein
MSMILAKLNAFNSEVPPVNTLQPPQLAAIATLKTSFSSETLSPLLPILADMILTWPSPKRFPAIDIMRLAAVKTPAQVVEMKSGDLGLVDILVEGAEMVETLMEGRKEVDVNSLLAVRAFVNLFDGEEGRSLMTVHYEKVPLFRCQVLRFSYWMRQRLRLPGRAVNLSKLPLRLFSSSTARAQYPLTLVTPSFSPSNPILTVQSPCSILRSRSPPSSTTVTDGQLIQDTGADSEALFRGLVALGTALSVDNDEVKAAACQVFGVKEALQEVKKRQSENRIKQVISEIEGFLA